MRITVVGGTGLIGTRLVRRLRADGHDVVAASRATGVNSYTGENLAEALAGAEALIDVSNSSYLDERGAQEFFYGSTLNLLTYGAAAGVPHHIALSIVGTDRLAAQQGGYFIAKAQQQRLIAESGRPYTIVHATQFFEFLPQIADYATQRGIARVGDLLIQPMAADDVAAAVAASVAGAPANAIVENGGPEIFDLADLLRRDLRFRRVDRDVIADPLGTYFGADVGRRDLLPAASATLAPTRFAQWQEAA
jgi:uncharacterized protein YbjT (DUF2867 family)